MAFSRKATRYYCDEEDLNGGIRRLCDRMAEFEQRQDEGEPTTQAEIADYWMDVGAAYTIELIKQTDYIENGERFVKLFDQRKKGMDDYED